MWATFYDSKGTVKNLDSGPIFFGSFLITGRFPRISKELKQRAKKLAKPGTGGATPFSNEKIPLLFLEWLLSSDNVTNMWSGVFYGLMFFGTLRPSITYTLSPKCFYFVDKHGKRHSKPSRKTKQILLEVFQFKNQKDHEKPKRLWFDWVTETTGPTPTNITLTLLFLFDKYKVSPTFPKNAKRMQKQLKKFKKQEKIRENLEKYTPESFRETMMGSAAEKLAPHELMYVTNHQSDRSIKHTYIRKQKANTWKQYNKVIANFFA